MRCSNLFDIQYVRCAICSMDGWTDGWMFDVPSLTDDGWMGDDDDELTLDVRYVR